MRMFRGRLWWWNARLFPQVGGLCLGLGHVIRLVGLVPCPPFPGPFLGRVAGAHLLRTQQSFPHLALIQRLPNKLQLTTTVGSRLYMVIALLSQHCPPPPHFFFSR